MKKEHTIYKITQSMTKSEKGYFKSFGFHKVNKNNDDLMRIFSLLGNMKEFKIEKLLNDKKISTTIKKNIYTNLNHLQKKIVRSLIDYRRGKSDFSIFSEGIMEYRLYLEKGLKDEALKKIIKTELFVEKKQMYFLKPYSYGRIFPILRNSLNSNAPKIKEQLQKFSESAEETYLITQAEIISISIESILHRNNGFIIKNKEDIKEIHKLILKIEKLLLNFKNNIFLYSVLSSNLLILNLMIGNTENINKQALMYIEDYKQTINEIQNEETIHSSMVTLKNIATISIHFKQEHIYYEALAILKIEISKLKKESYVFKVNSAITYLQVLFYALLQKKEIKLVHLDKALEALKKADKSKINYFELLLPSSILLIREKRYTESLNLTAEIIQSDFSNRSMDTILSIKLLRVIAWLKLENLELFDSELNALYKYLLKNRSFDFEINILNFIKKLSTLSSGENKQKHFVKIISEFDDIQKIGTGTEMMKAIELKTILELGL